MTSSRNISFQHYSIQCSLLGKHVNEPHTSYMEVLSNTIVEERFKKRDFQTETALMYDAVILFAEALSELDRSQDVQVMPHPHLHIMKKFSDEGCIWYLG